MRCRECGLEVDNDRAFCPVCGAPLKVTADYEYIQAEIANKVDRFFNDEQEENTAEPGDYHDSEVLTDQDGQFMAKTRNIYGNDSIFDDDHYAPEDYLEEPSRQRQGDYPLEDEDQPEYDDDGYDDPGYDDDGYPDDGYEEEDYPEDDLMDPDPDYPKKPKPRRRSYDHILVPYEEKDRTAAKVITGLIIFLIIAAAAVGVMAILGVFSDNTEENGGVSQSVSSLKCNIEPGGVYTLPLEIVIDSATEGNIFYTLDGTEPTAVSRIYTGPFTITALDVMNSYPSVRLRATSFGEDSEKSGEINMEFELEYNEADAALIAEQMTTTAEPETTTAITLSAPIISPSSGSYSENTQIMVSSPEGADIFYTYDGTVPGPRSNLYTGPVMMTPGTQTFSAVCIKDGVESLVSSCTFTLEYDYPYSAQEAIDLVTNELMWDGYTMDYDLHTYDDGYAKLTHQGVYEIDGYTYYIIKVDIYTSTDTLESTEYRGVGVNFGNVYFVGEENGSYYIRW